MGFFSKLKYKKILKNNGLTKLIDILLSETEKEKLNILSVVENERAKELLDALYALLQDESIDVRCRAISLIGNFKEKGSIPVLINCISDEYLAEYTLLPKTVLQSSKEYELKSGESQYMRIVTSVAKSLVKIGEEVSGFIPDLIHSENARVKGVGIALVGYLKLDKYLSEMCAILNDSNEDPIMRSAAALSVETINGKIDFNQFVNTELSNPLEMYTAIEMRQYVWDYNFKHFEMIKQGASVVDLIDFARTII